MNKVNKLTLKSPDFPDVLRHIPDPPKQLYVRGSLDSLTHHAALAVVGSRKITPYGREITQRLISDMSDRDIVIISGLALGVDVTAHQAALSSGLPTIAVMACGLDVIYPATHRKVAEKIIQQGGAVVSEYPIGTPPLRHNFIERNRIVAGLSQAVLITEAAQKSGTLHTARFALEQGRSVLAVPGNITSHMSHGTNNLIAQGARVIRDSSDITNELGLDNRTQQTHMIIGDTEAENTIIELLRSGHSSGKQLLEHSDLTAEEYNQTITMLEISGKIRALGADHWGLK